MFKRQSPNFGECTDEYLMQLVCQGKRQAFEQLYERYNTKLLYFAGGFIADRSQCEDLVQELFLKIIEKPQLFDSNKKFSVWIFVLCANLCKQNLRNHKNRQRILNENIKPFAENSYKQQNQYDKQGLKNKINEVLLLLSEKERSLYLLRYEQEHSIAEIAEILELPEGSVKSGLFYLLKKFALHLKEYSYEH